MQINTKIMIYSYHLTHFLLVTPSFSPPTRCLAQPPVIYHTLEKHKALKVQVCLTPPLSIWNDWGPRLDTVTHVWWIVSAGETWAVKLWFSRDGGSGLPALSFHNLWMRISFKFSPDVLWKMCRHQFTRMEKKGTANSGSAAFCACAMPEIRSTNIVSSPSLALFVHWKTALQVNVPDTPQCSLSPSHLSESFSVIGFFSSVFAFFYYMNQCLLLTMWWQWLADGFQ